jgi:hypothetical protein
MARNFITFALKQIFLNQTRGKDVLGRTSTARGQIKKRGLQICCKPRMEIEEELKEVLKARVEVK